MVRTNVVVKKAAHFNLKNEEDKLLLEFIEKNNINFSALSKELLVKYKNNQLVTKDEVRNIAEEITLKILEEKLTNKALENSIRKVLLESFLNNPNNNLTMLLSTNTNDADVTEQIIDNAVNNYTDEDLEAMNF